MSGPDLSTYVFLVALLSAARGARADVAGAQAGPDIDFARSPVLRSPTREPASWTSACSFRHPVCIHAPLEVAAARSLAALAAADRAWDVLTGAHGLPPPDSDLEGVWRVYLVDDVDGGGRGLLDGRDPRTHFDRGTSFALVDRGIAPGCALDLALARALARSSLWAAAPATDEGSASAETETLARLAVVCEGFGQDAQEFQSNPERTMVAPSSPAFERGASLFFDWLDATFTREPGALIRGLWALAPTRTPPSAWRWSGSPTGFDVLRVSLKGVLSSNSTLDDLFVRFAIVRAHVPPAVRLAWHLPWPVQPRRLSSSEPVFPTGASYVLVDHAGAPPGATLRLEAQWEDYGRMRWVVLKVDAAGRTMAEMPVTSLDRGTRASLTVESLDLVDRVLIMGVNVGSTEQPFDPDQGEWEPHGWLLTVGAQ